MLMGLLYAAARPVLRAWVAYSSGSWSRLPQPADEPRVATPGVDHDRILLVGSGPSVGYGVLRHELAFSGHMVRRIAAITGRATVVDVIADGTMSVGDCRKVIAGVDLSEIRAIVTTIGVNETFTLSSVAAWRRDLVTLLDYLDQVGPEALHTFVIGVLPARSIAPSYSGPVAWLWNRHSRALNAQTRAECARRGNASYLPFNPIPAPDTDRYRSTETYRGWAELVVAPIAAHLARHERGPRSG